MNRIKETIKIIHEEVTFNDWDYPFVVAGDEGTGKTRFLLHWLEEWSKISNKKPTLENFADDKLQLGQILKNIQKGSFVGYDEGGEISARTSLSKFNINLMLSYQIIRGENLCTGIAIPSIFDLDSFFRKRRTKGLFYVYERGKVAFWNKQRLRRLIEINENRPYKNYWLEQPLWHDHFPDYKGELLEEYQERKKLRMKKARSRLLYVIEQLDRKGEPTKSVMSERDTLIVSMANKIGAAKTAEVVGLTKRQIYNICKGKGGVNGEIGNENE